MGHVQPQCRRAAASVEVQQSRIQQLETSLERLADRHRKRLGEERALLSADPEDAAIMELSEQLAESEATLEDLQTSEEAQVEKLEQLRQQLQQALYGATTGPEAICSASTVAWRRSKPCSKPRSTRAPAPPNG